MIVEPVGYPTYYLLCPICRVPAGAECRSRSGVITEGQPDGTITPLDRPHIARRRSARPAASLAEDIRRIDHPDA